MKKDLLFIMNNLTCGGAEKALISLLQTIDYSKYNVDLYLFKHEGLFMSQLPKEVNLLPAPELYPYFDMSIKKAVLENLKSGNFNVVLNRLKMAILFKTEKHPAIREQKLWKYLSKCLIPLEKEYDLAVGFLEKTPNYFCVDKVNAKVKVGFVHNDYDKLGMDTKIDAPYFEKLQHVATISEECLVSLQRSFPYLTNKFIILKNISSPRLILKLAEEKTEPLFSGLKLLTVGRLSEQKGYDFAIKAATILKEKHKIDFRWYILGTGPLQDQLNKQIEAEGVHENIVFLGLKENPYPYIKQSDLYVQPSRFEGKSVAIDEAKILHKPIIVTNFNSAKDQITNEQNGLIVEMNPEAIADGIARLHSNNALQQKLIAALKTEEMGNENEIEKLYALIQ